jgi:hypothetical protein
MNAAMPLSGAGVGRAARKSVAGAAVLVVILAVVVGTAVLATGKPGMSGTYRGPDGRSGLEFRGSRVFVTSTLGTTFVAEYEVDGDRVIIKGAGGAQVYHRQGDALDGGVGIRFVRQLATDRGQAAAEETTLQESK